MKSKSESMTRKQKSYRPPTENEITGFAYAIYAQEQPQHAIEIWRQAQAQLIASRKHEAGLV